MGRASRSDADRLVVGLVDGGKTIENVADAMSVLERVAQTTRGVEQVVVPATNPAHREISALLEVSEYASNRAFGDADQTR